MLRIFSKTRCASWLKKLCQGQWGRWSEKRDYRQPIDGRRVGPVGAREEALGREGRRQSILWSGYIALCYFTWIFLGNWLVLGNHNNQLSSDGSCFGRRLGWILLARWLSQAPNENILEVVVIVWSSMVLFLVVMLKLFKEIYAVTYIYLIHCHCFNNQVYPYICLQLALFICSHLSRPPFSVEEHSKQNKVSPYMAMVGNREQIRSVKHTSL